MQRRRKRGRPQRRFKDVTKDMQRVGVIEADARDSVRWGPRSQKEKNMRGSRGKTTCGRLATSVWKKLSLGSWPRDDKWFTKSNMQTLVFQTKVGNTSNFATQLNDWHLVYSRIQLKGVSSHSNGIQSTILLFSFWNACYQCHVWDSWDCCCESSFVARGEMFAMAITQQTPRHVKLWLVTLM